MSHSPEMPLPPETPREQQEKRVSQHNEQIHLANARDKTEGGYWNQESNAQRDFLFLIVRGSHRIERPRQNQERQEEV